LKGINSNLIVSEEEKVQASKFILQSLLPHLKGINDEQVAEKEVEAKIYGTFFAFIYDWIFVIIGYTCINSQQNLKVSGFNFLSGKLEAH
jgi:hypothetical protein